MRKLWRTACALAAAVFLFGGCAAGGKKDRDGASSDVPVSSSEEAMPSPESAESEEDLLLPEPEEEATPTPTPSPTPTPVPVFTIPSLDGTYQVDVPDDWQNMQGQMDDAGHEFPIEAGSYDNQVFLLVSREPKAGSPFDSLDAFYQALVKRITNNRALSQVQVFTPSSITLEKTGLAGRKVLFTAMYNPSYGAGEDESAAEEAEPALQRIAYRIYVTEDSNWFYQFCGWTTGVNAVATEDLFDRVVDSLQISG